MGYCTPGRGTRGTVHRARVPGTRAQKSTPRGYRAKNLNPPPGESRAPGLLRFMEFRKYYLFMVVPQPGVQYPRYPGLLYSTLGTLAWCIPDTPTVHNKNKVYFYKQKVYFRMN